MRPRTNLILSIVSAMCACAVLADPAPVPMRDITLGTLVYEDNLTNSLSPIAFSETYDSATNALMSPVYTDIRREHAYNMTNYISEAYWNESIGPRLSDLIGERATTNVVNLLESAIYQAITNLAISGIEIDGHTYRLVEVNRR